MDQGNTAFLLIAAALVLLMTPGLAFFYGGLVKAKSVISMMMMSFGAMGLIGLLWVLYGYAIAFGNGPDGAAGNPRFVGIDGVLGIDLGQLGLGDAYTAALGDQTSAYPTLAFAAFQATFAIITVALISGAIADRAKFGAWMVFAGVWATVVYFPVASWVFNFTLADGATVDGGWIAYNVGAIDFAGGTAVHINAGAAALALSLVLGKRVGFAKGMHVPHNPPFVLLGAGLLWFGWFGFNAGSELAADASRPSRSSTPSPPRPPRSSAGSWSRRSATASRPRWAPPPARSRDSSRSPRRAPRSRRPGPSSSASSPVPSAPSRSS